MYNAHSLYFELKNYVGVVLLEPYFPHCVFFPSQLRESFEQADDYNFEERFISKQETFLVRVVQLNLWIVVVMVLSGGYCS